MKTLASDKKGWSYVVCFGTIITFVAGIGHVNSFGLIFNDFIKETNSSAKSLTTANGTFAIMLAFGGIILNVVRKKVTLQTGGLIGAFTFCIGSFTTIFIPSAYQLPLTFGILQGIGFGMMVPVCYSTLNRHFVTKRTTVMSLCKAIQGFLQMGYPQLIRMIMSQYGFRGTLMILSGISLHTIAGMCTMKTLDGNEVKKIRIANDVERKTEPYQNVNFLRQCDLHPDNKKINDKTVYNTMRRWFLEYLNLKSLKDPVFVNICVGQSFVNFSDLMFFVLRPMLLFQYGYEKDQVATCISISAGADLGGRCVLALLSSTFDINTRVLFYVATLCTLVLRIVMLQVQQFVWMAFMTASLGLLRAWLHVSSPLVISSHISHEEFPGAYSLFMLATGLVNVSLAPVVGQLKDVFEDYVPTFYMLSLCCLPCLVLWPLERLFTKT